MSKIKIRTLVSKVKNRALLKIDKEAEASTTEMLAQKVI